MISVVSKTFDLAGALEIDPNIDGVTFAANRRTSRAATLDGGAVITDQGYSDGDRTLIVRYKAVSEAHDDLARRILRYHARVYVTTDEGTFEAAPDSFENVFDENTFTFLILRRADGG